jgi:hypothetical protein
MGEYAKFSGEEIKIGTCEEIDPSFGNWLAGFIDGEGCFSIFRDPNRKSFRCRFDLVLRRDDEAILVEIAGRTKLGYISRRRAIGRSAPSSTWVIQSKGGCAALATLLVRFPLRAKKLRDFQIWHRTVLTWAKMKKGQRYGNASVSDEMSALREQLNAGRGKRYHVIAARQQELEDRLEAEGHADDCPYRLAPAAECLCWRSEAFAELSDLEDVIR